MCTFKPASLDDFESIFELLSQLYVKDDIKLEQTRLLFTQCFAQPNYSAFIMQKDNQPIGFASFTTRIDLQDKGKILELHELVIDKKERNKGFGTNFVDELMCIAKSMNCIEFRLTSNFKRKDAHKFYDSRGFNKTAYLFWKKV